MKKLLTKITLFALLLCGAVTVWSGNVGTTYASTTSGTTYYSGINSTSKNIYNAINEMNTSETLKENGDKDITSLFTVSNIKDYQNGDKSLLKNFAWARDAYYLDHPEIFYVNFDNLAIGLYQKNGEYVAYINSGRTGNYLMGFENKDKIDSAVTNFNAKVDEYVAQINSSVATIDENTQNKEKEEFETKVRKANELLAENVTYSFGTTTDTAQHIRTAYGALVNNEAVCEGFARAFKVLMDKVGIDCQIVIGYYVNGDNYEPHAWNKVCYKGKWYLVDPTFSARTTATKKTEAERANYELLGSNATKNYVEANYVSGSDITFSSPQLATYNFGIDEITTSVETKKTTKAEETDTIKEGTPYQVVHYAYNGKNAQELKEQDNLYVVARHQQTNDSSWSSVYAIYDYFGEELTFSSKYYNVQFFVVTDTPKESYMFDKSLDQLNVIAESEIIYNDFFKVESLVPVATNITPNNSGRYPAEEPLDISVVYDMQLKKSGDTISITPKIKQKNNDGEIEDVSVAQYTKVENIKFDEATNKLSFTFTPSLQYAHDSCTYYFYISGLVAEENSVAPHPITFNFNRKWTVCSKVYDGGRLYMDVYGAPVLIDNQDLSVNDFTDKDGNKYAQNQRSQMMLVASKITGTQSDTMIEKAKEELKVENVLSSSTYELDLHICGTVATIPNGSYMRLAFGFPEGYSKDDAGVTFKVYHYTKDGDGNITGVEEIPCVVTEYGLVATVTSFSPYAVVAVNKSDLTVLEENKTKSVYSYVSAGKGSVSAKVQDTSTTAIASVKNGEKIVYTFTPSENEKIDFVLLNKNKVTVKEENDAYTLELNFSELQDDNVLQVAFVNKDVAKKEQDKGLTNLNLSFSQNEKDNYIEEVSNTFTIRLIIAMVVVLCAIGFIGAITILEQKKKKQAYQEAQNNKNKK